MTCVIELVRTEPKRTKMFELLADSELQQVLPALQSESYSQYVELLQPADTAQPEKQVLAGAASSLGVPGSISTHWQSLEQKA